MWDEIQDMPGEIFDVPGIETVLVEDEDGNVGVDLTDVNNWPMMPLLPMTETMDNIVNRDELQDNLINQILDDMDIKTMMALLYDVMDENYDKYSVDELIEEVEEYYPDLLENE